VTSESRLQSPGTTSADYRGDYYDDGAELTGVKSAYANYSWDTDHWRNFFQGVADRIIAISQPSTFLDLGCARGLLVQAMAMRGVDAEGIDISEHAVESAHADVRDRLRVGSAAEPLARKYDLISCIETLEHMDPETAQQAIDAMTAATDRILFSSTPRDFDEATHINVHPIGQWAAWFAERGFYRRADVDPTFLAPWALYLERAEPSTRTLVHMYEEQLAPLREEVVEKRNALLDAQRRANENGTTAGIADRNLDDDAILRRHAELVAKDNVMGLEARIVNLENQIKEVTRRNKKWRNRAEDAEQLVRDLQASRTWRAGRIITGPLGRLRGR